MNRRFFPNRQHYRPPSRNTNNNESQRRNSVCEKIHKYLDSAINFFMLIVNIVVAWLAFTVYIETREQTKSAIKAADASVKSVDLADSVFRETKRYNDSSLSVQKAIFDSSIVDGQRRSERESKLDKQSKISLDAQIATIKQNQRQFEINNRPFLQIADIKIDTLIEGKPIQMSFNLHNYGKMPALISESYYGVFLSQHVDHRDVGSEYGYLQLKHKSYITNNIVENYISTGLIADKKIFDLIKNGRTYLFLLGSFKYVDPITYKSFRYKFRFRLYFTSILIKEEIENSNIELR